MLCDRNIILKQLLIWLTFRSFKVKLT